VNRGNDEIRPTDQQPSTDAEERDDPTAAAPSFRAPAIEPARGRQDSPTVPLAVPVERILGKDRPLALLPGARVDDFEIVRMLGRGAFGIVYLARQISLDRHVALKVSANRGSEGRTMARLEHQHIVQVFSESVEVDFNQRLLCMQLVPGVSLDKLIGAIHAKWAGKRTDGPPPWTGRELLSTIDSAASLPAAFDPSALHDREALAAMDAVEATAWFGSRLAEALDFAHKHGVLHRDIKPANILVNPYGRPMLADFNISSQPTGSEPGGEEVFGGTFAYMAPEHLDAFNPSDPTEPEAVDQRSDLYSLGLVLNQLLAGRMSFEMPPPGLSLAETLRVMSDERREKHVTCREGSPSARQTLERTIGRLLEPAPENRFANGAQLAEQLDGCRQLRAAERQLPQPRRWATWILARPFLWLVVLVILPQLVASAVNITYNLTQIVGHFTDEQRQWFNWLVLGYNAIVYPIALAVFVMVVRPVWQCWLALGQARPLSEEQAAAARQKALRLPRWIALLAALGWYPGGILFPLVIEEWAPPLAPHLAGHLIASFWLSGLIAMAYSLCGVQFVVLRVLYPGMWLDTRHFASAARQELAPMSGRLTRIQFLAGSIPLVGAILLVILGGGTANLTFRLLVAGLIALGIVGYHFASAVTGSLSQVVVTLTTSSTPARPDAAPL
jgi:serine/threonine protein kinase